MLLWWSRVRVLCGWMVKRPKTARERFLMPEEWTKVRAVLDQQPPKVRVYFLILMLEGSRMGELRYMAWAHVDLKAGLWHKPMTKNGRAQTLALSVPACELLDSLPRRGLYVFHGEHPDLPWSKTAVFYHWDKIRFLAGLPDVQIRDLRRTCASWLSIHGENMPVVQNVLNHKNQSTLHVYARLDQTAVRAALTRHAERVLQP